MKITFTKMTAGGNDFIVLENYHGGYDLWLTDTAARVKLFTALCRRGFGVGADGVILTAWADAGQRQIGVRFFDADGGEALFCGNGSVCITHLALAEKRVPSAPVILQTASGMARGEPLGDAHYRLFTPLPTDFSTRLELTVVDQKFSADYLRVGVPHLVVPVKNVEQFDLKKYGAALRHHSQFTVVGGVNVNFVETVREGEIKIRTFEVGVEAETLSCGSGSIAAAIATCRRENWTQKFWRGTMPIIVWARSGEKVQINFALDEKGHPIFAALITSARQVCTGEIAEIFTTTALTNYELKGKS